MKKRNAMRLITSSLTKKIAAGVVVLSLVASCKKDTVPTPVPPLAVTHSYTGEWKNVLPVSPAGPLDFFNFDIKLDSAGAGILNTVYIQNNQPYVPTNLSWQKIAGDSVVIILNMPAYPDEKWELRGLSTDSNNKITADYFSIPNNNPSAKHKYGTFVLTKI